MMIKFLRISLVVSLLLASSLTTHVNAQQYDYDQSQDYGQGDYGEADNLYQDYAARQQQKAVGGKAYVQSFELECLSYA